MQGERHCRCSEHADALQSSLDATNANVDTAVALGPAVMADALFDALQSGAPFAGELAAMRGLGLDEAALDGLAPHAESGLPTLAALRADFEAAASAVDLDSAASGGNRHRRPAAAKARAAWSRCDPPIRSEGSDPPAVLARIRGALDAGDLRSRAR